MNQDTPTRTRRIGVVFGLSLYAVEVQRPAPTFTKGDGHDGGRNLLSALLIGPSWSTVGYVLGSRGEWSAYTQRDWIAAHPRNRAPVCQWSPQPTVADAADAVVTMIEQQVAAA